MAVEGCGADLIENMFEFTLDDLTPEMWEVLRTFGLVDLFLAALGREAIGEVVLQQWDKVLFGIELIYARM